MHSFIVFQNKSYIQERLGSFLWAPERVIPGMEKYNWENIVKVKKGDVIYSVKNRKIVSVNIAKSNCIKAEKPEILDATIWGNDGWLIDLKYNDLGRPVILDNHIKQIQKLCTLQSSPFEENGENKYGYIFEIPYDVHKYLINIIKPYNTLDIKVMSDEDVKYLTETEAMLKKCDNELQKEFIIKKRLSQGLFRNRVMFSSAKCALCDIALEEILNASYIKSWNECGNTERLDINNALLLCPTHSQLFEEGYITFDNNGIIKISNSLHFNHYKSLNINRFNVVHMNKDIKEYMKWHRENVFQK